METLLEILSPGFLLRNSLYTSLLVGAACPLVGVFLVLRRLAFLGVALPQISSTGVALALSLHVWFGPAHSHDHGTNQLVAFLGAFTFSLLAVVALAFMERQRDGRTDGRLGAAYVVATAVSILLLAKCPQAEQSWLTLFKGEIIAVTTGELVQTLVLFALALAVLGWHRRTLLLVSFDPDLATILKVPVHRWNLVLFVIIGLTVGVSVLAVGPLISFGFMLVPPLIAHRFAGNMKQLAVGAAGIGTVAAFGGFYVAYAWDLPVGPASVGILGAMYAIVFLATSLPGAWRRRG
jgi:ABC-type Mn2+/Zn2+ transport system permease subunit